MYNQGYQATGQLAPAHYPAGARAIAGQLNGPPFAPFTAEWQDAG